jgi:serine/threonine protein kinase
VLLQCPECKRSFREPGFCPYDGKRLVEVENVHDKPTVGSAMVPVQLLDSLTQIGTPTSQDEPRTVPLGPPSSSGAQTAVASAPGTRQVPDDVQAQIDKLRADHRTEYDRLVGETLEGRYRVIRKIGEGGMGVVFAARHTVIERPLAIKVLKREVMRDAGTIRRFVREAKAASRIGHPNIVDVTDFGQTADGLTFSVMEYIEGQTLSQAIRHGAPFQIARALRIAAQIARALGTAHDKGIVHRDLKPENVFLLDRDGRPDFVKIVDFGIAKVAPAPGDPNEPRLTKAGAVFGTPEYMAPEQAAGRGDTDGRVDVYALGVILYEMIVGRVPHRGETMVRTLAMQMLDAIVPPTVARPDLGIPLEVEGVMLKALAKKRETRFQTMGELLDSLDHLAREVLPAPVAHNAAGSAVYALARLPPGADPSLQPLLPAVPLSDTPPGAPSSITAPLPSSSQPMAVARPAVASAAHPAFRESAQLGVPQTQTQRRLHEPAFVSQHELNLHDSPTIPPTHGARWPIVVGGVLGLGAIVAGAVVALSRNDQPPSPPPAVRDAAVVTPPADATVIAEIPADAGIADAQPTDAGVPDAAVRVDVPHNPPHNPNPTAPHDAGITIDPTTHRGTIAIQVMTKPDTARLYVGTTYRGPGGTTLEEPAGTVYDVQCRAAGYKPGTVRVAFDGRVEVALCAMTRIKICIDNIKNPFDDCEIDPTRPSPDPDHNNSGSG